MIDTHAHIDTKAFDADRGDVIARAWEAGLEAIVIPAIMPSTFERVRQTVALDPRLYNGAGVHPHHAHECTDADLAHVEAWASDPKTVAIGEIGLDYHYDFCPKDVQQRVFREQLRIAKRVGLPVIIHNRSSDDDVLRILEEEQDGTLRGVLHCFSGTVDMLERTLALSMHVSFTGNITFKQSTLDETVRAVPDGRYMIETDSPYITPVPFRGQRNEPMHVRRVAEHLAEIRGMTFEQLLERTTSTARSFFALPLLLLAFVLAGTIATAQPTPPDEDEFEYEEQYDRAMESYELDSIAWAKWIKPKSLGIGFNIGTNTVVERQQFTQRFTRGDGTPGSDVWTFYPTGTGPKRSQSFDGLAALGATLMYSLNDRITLEGSYIYSKNDGPARLFGLDPTTMQIMEGSFHYSLNPYSRINFIVHAGATFATINDGETVSSKIGPNVGLSLGANINTPVGLFYPMFILRFNIMMGEDVDRVVTRYTDLNNGAPIVKPGSNPPILSEDRADVTTIYSIPRLVILWYPNL